MPTPFTKNVWFLRFVTFALAAGAAGSAAFWALQWNGPATGTVLAVDTQPVVMVDSTAVARALGAPNAATGADANAATAAIPAASRFALTGVVAWRSQNGAALIAVDAKPPKPFSVGAKVAEDWVLKSVQARSAVLAGAAGQELVLELPLVSNGKNGP